MMTDVTPGLVLILGALLVPVLPRALVRPYLLLLPLASAAHLAGFFGGDMGNLVTWTVFDYTFHPLRVDKLALVFATVFHLGVFVSVIYALHVEDRLQHVAALVYAGSAIAAVFAGDLVTLFVYWELTAIASVFLIWARRTERAVRAGMRYLTIQVGSGVILLAGILFHWNATHSLAFDHLGLGSIGTNLIFLAFGIKCAFPFLHGWLQDTYPEATVTGTVFLSAFTTKLAVYALARGYAGTEILVWIGAAMTAFPIFYAVIENDLRRVLSYSLNNQLGFMVVGIGIGTELSLNGTAAHAFAHILYKALLFMSMGAVLHRVGTIKGSELGGLYKSMPITAGLCMIGAASISAFPLFSGFISKSLILSAAVEGHYMVPWFVLLFASAGVFHHSGIKIPFFAFFAHDSGKRCKEAPAHMLVAMGITAGLCVFLGVYPDVLYRLLPYDVEYHPYTTTHVVTQLQLLLFSAMAFTFLMKTGLYPKETPSVNLDVDVLYRKGLPALARGVLALGGPLWRGGAAQLERWGATARRGVYRMTGPQGLWERTWTTGSTVLWVTLLLGAFLLLTFA